MTDKITPQHLQRMAYVYVRQSSMGKYGTIMRARNDNMPCRTERVRAVGSQVELKYSTETWDVPVRPQMTVPTSRHSLWRCRWAMPELFWR